MELRPIRTWRSVTTGNIRPKVWGQGRECTVCDQKLNKYNKGPTCYAHAPLKRPRLRGRAPNSLDSACRQCSAKYSWLRRYDSEIYLAEIILDRQLHRAATEGAATLCDYDDSLHTLALLLSAESDVEVEPGGEI